MRFRCNRFLRWENRLNKANKLKKRCLNYSKTGPNSLKFLSLRIQSLLICIKRLIIKKESLLIQWFWSKAWRYAKMTTFRKFKLWITSSKSKKWLLTRKLNHFKSLIKARTIWLNASVNQKCQEVKKKCNNKLWRTNKCMTKHRLSLNN